MLDMKDSAIKLFGKTIPLPVLHHVDLSSANESCSAAAPVCRDFSHASSLENMFRTKQELNKELPEKEITDDEREDGTSNHINGDLKDPTTSSDANKKPKTSSDAIENSPQKGSKNEEQCDTSISLEKTLKKPDKILPCPRCNSMDTKFCYYNNYNVNQPRHFCKNCHRYWTAGGTMRNVPVGAGRRKNKSSAASHYRHIMVSEALRTAQVHAIDGVHNPSLRNNSTVLSFGSDSPLCESVASVLSLSDKAQNNNGYHRPEQRILISYGGVGDDADDRLSVSSVTASNSSEKRGNCRSHEAATKNYQGYPPQVPRFPGSPWSYPWSSSMHPPGFCPSGFPNTFYPALSYWSCTASTPWNAAPCLSPQSPSLSHCAASSSPTSPLGKHSREGKVLFPAHSESEDPSRESNSSEISVLIPKTLRIDDPSEAAKSSTWATLRIRSSDKSNLNGGGLFKGFQSKNEDTNYIAETSSLLHGNPAALSRSLNFHEST